MSGTFGCTSQSMAFSALFTCSSSRQLHQGERGAAVWAVGIAERLSHLEVIVVGRLDQLDRLARRLHGGGEVPVLALELRRLVGAVGGDDRRVQALELALRAHRMLHVVVEL